MTERELALDALKAATHSLRLASAIFNSENFTDHKWHALTFKTDVAKAEKAIAALSAPVQAEPVNLAIKFHTIYERLAPSFGYVTRDDTKSFDPTTPNGRLMIAVCEEILNER